MTSSDEIPSALLAHGETRHGARRALAIGATADRRRVGATIGDGDTLLLDLPAALTAIGALRDAIRAVQGLDG